MELRLVEKGLGIARRRKNWIILLAALSFSGYGAYKFYHLPSIARKRARICKCLGAFLSLAEAVSNSAESVGVISRDLKDFLQSDSDQIPNSLKQISKIARSNEVSESVVLVAQAVTIGVLRGYNYGTRSNGKEHGATSSFIDHFMDKLFSPDGSGFASIVVGSFARNLVMGFCSDGKSGGASNSSNSESFNDLGPETKPVPEWVDVVCGDKCKDLIGDCIQLFVSTAVAVFLEKTMHINPYDEFFSGMTNPKHEAKVRDTLVSVCNGAVETLVRTSHKVLASSDPKDQSGSAPYLAIQEDATISGESEESAEEISLNFKPRKSFDSKRESGWASQVSSTLAVPSNRKLVLDVTGRVTFETVRSFLVFLMEILYEGIRKCIDVAHDAVVEKVLGIARYAALKSSVVATVCISLCLHVMGSVWIFVPA